MRFLVLFAIPLAGCSLPHWTTSSVVSGQTPGTARGAGAELVGPANAAAPSVQRAERREAFYAPTAASLPTVDPMDVVATQITPPAIEAPHPAWTYEKVETTIGQHQDAAGIVKVAMAAQGWPTLRWLGILCILVGIGGILHSMGNHETGYPIVWLKVCALGIFFIFAGDNPLWLFLLLIPLLFYIVQKLGLWRLPPLP